MQRASHSAIGFPSSSTSASWMLAFVTPADVSRSSMPPPEAMTPGPGRVHRWRSVPSGDWRATENSSAGAGDGFAIADLPESGGRERERIAVAW
jgi:hypothetical protein